MQVTHGEPGCTGYPARLSGLDAYGVRGNGQIQIGNRDENPFGFRKSLPVQWVPSRTTGTMFCNIGSAVIPRILTRQPGKKETG